MSAQAVKLKEEGNRYFKRGEYETAEEYYSQAIQKDSLNPLLWTNRAHARLKLDRWHDVMDDCIRSVELNAKDNLKAYYLLGQAQLAVNHPNEALTSALTAYDICTHSIKQTTDAFTISTFVIKCKKAKWDLRERDRLRRRSDLLAELEDKLEQDKKKELWEIDESVNRGEMGPVGAHEEKQLIEDKSRAKIQELQTVFALADPTNLTRREIPDYLIDPISFELIHDPVVTRTGHSYEKSTLLEHLKRNPVDPLTREPIRMNELKNNVALKQACEDFLENSKGWIYEW